MRDTLALRFGANQYIPDGLKAAWGARLIVSQGGMVDLVHDRQDAAGDDALVADMLAWVNHGAWAAARDKIAEALRTRTIQTTTGSPFLAYEDERGIMLGNTNGSHGYFYLVAWLFDAVPDKARGDHLFVADVHYQHKEHHA